MSRDRFDDELRATVRRSIQRAAPDRLRDRVLEVSEQPARTSSRFSASWRLAAAAAVAVLAVAVAYAGYSVLGPRNPAASPSPSPSVSPAVTTPSPTVAAVAASLRWSAPGVISGDFFPMDVIAWHGEYVAVGQVSSSAATQGGVFTSPDGVHWTRADAGQTFRDVPVRLAATSRYLVAIGDLQLPAGCPQGEGAVCTPAQAAPVWYSPDARTWTEVNPQIFGASYFDGLGLQAGARGALIEGETVSGKPELWYSPDGADWQRVTLPAALQQATFSGGAVTPNGFVVVGRQNQPGPAGLGHQFGYGLPAAWWSTDGLTWQTSTIEGAVPAPGAELGPIDVGADGILVVGTDNPDASKSALTWTSTDGKAFHLLGDLAASVPYATQTASDGQRIVKLGPVSPYGAGNEDTLAAWVSTDGASWQQLTLVGDAADMPAGASGGGSPSKAQMQDVFVVSDGLIVIGSQDVTELSWYVPATWPAAPPPPTPSATPTPTPTPTIPSPPPAEHTSTWTSVSLPVPSAAGQPVGGPGGGIAALPGGGFVDFVIGGAQQTYVYTSPDGQTWKKRGTVTGADALGITGPVASNGKVYVALGMEGGGAYYGPQYNGAAWVSSDLAHWTRAPAQPALAGVTFEGIAGSSAGFVAIGYDQGGLRAVWFSADGQHWAAETDANVFPTAEATEVTGIVHTLTGFVMVGRIGDNAAAWTSSNGRTWTLHSALPGGSGVVLTGLADGPAGLVTLGVGGSQVQLAPDDVRSAVAPWISSDGITWHVQTASAALFGATATIVGAPGGYVAAGTVGLDPGADLWTSTHSVSWVPVAGVDLSGSGSVDHLVSDGRHVLLVGQDAKGGPLALVSAGVQR